MPLQRGSRPAMQAMPTTASPMHAADLCPALQQLPGQGDHTQHHVGARVVHKHDRLAVGAPRGKVGQEGVQVVDGLQGGGSG
jgi:hypothetical protein